MKKNILVLGITCLLVACSSDNKPDSGIYDMKTVQEYNARVQSGNTVVASQKARVSKQEETPLKMNASDEKAKVRIISPTLPVVPAVGVGYYHHYHNW